MSEWSPKLQIVGSLDGALTLSHAENEQGVHKRSSYSKPRTHKHNEHQIVRYFIYMFGTIGPTMLICLETNSCSIMAHS